MGVLSLTLGIGLSPEDLRGLLLLSRPLTFRVSAVLIKQLDSEEKMSSKVYAMEYTGL
jgi:hypothetical protein